MSGRVSVFSLAIGLCAARKGVSPRVMYEDARRSFELQLETQREFGFDSPPLYLHATYGTWEHAAGLGYPSSELRDIPTPPHYPVRGEADLESLVLPDVRRAGMLPVAMRFSELQEECGLPVSVVLGGVFTVAANLCGMQNLLCWMIERPQLVHGLLERSGEHLLEVVQHWVERFGAARVTPILWEAVANHRTMSPRHFSEFVLPHQRTLHRGILGLGIRNLLCHMCGEQGPQLTTWAEIPMGSPGSPGIVSVGCEVDLAEASRAFPEAILMGNLDPLLLERGEPDEVRAQALRCLEQGTRHAAGFILAPGCELQRGVPSANLRAMVAAAARV
jgi:uroporphyrinogen decarboxylase